MPACWNWRASSGTTLARSRRSGPRSDRDGGPVRGGSDDAPKKIYGKPLHEVVDVEAAPPALADEEAKHD